MKVIKRFIIRDDLQSLILDEPLFNDDTNIVLIGDELVEYSMPLGLPIEALKTELLIKNNKDYVGMEVKKNNA